MSYSELPTIFPPSGFTAKELNTQKDIEKEALRAVPRRDAKPQCPVCKMFHYEPFCKESYLNNSSSLDVNKLKYLKALEDADKILSDYLGPKHPVRLEIQKLM